MRNNNFRKIIIAAIFSAALCLSSCANEWNPFGLFTPGSEDKYYYVDSNELFIPMNNISKLNPVISEDRDTYLISKLVYDPLFTLDEDLFAKPVLVKNYKYSDDMMSLTLNLRNDIKWQDGKDLTAADVKFSIECYQKAAWDGIGLYKDNVANISYVRTEDDSTVKIFFNSAEGTNLEKLVFPIISEHQYSSYYGLKSNKDWMMGTGIYKLVSYDSVYGLKLEPNEYYWGEAAKNSIEFKLVPDDANIYKLLDVTSLSMFYTLDSERVAKSHNVSVKTNELLSNECVLLGFNLYSEAVSNENMRHAIAFAIDTANVIESAYSSSGIETDCIYYPGIYASKNNGDKYVYSKSLANEYIEKAGYVNEDNDKYYDNLSLRLLYRSDDSEQTSAANIIARNLDDAGITVTLTGKAGDEYKNAVYIRDFDIYIGDYRFAADYDLSFLLSSSSYTPSGFNNKACDRAIAILKSGASKDEKTDAFNSLKALLNDMLPYYPLMQRTSGLICTDAIVGESSPAFFNPYMGIENLSLSYARKIEAEIDVNEDLNEALEAETEANKSEE